MILILLAGSSGQSILTALHQFYHLSWLRPEQPVTAAILPPLAYLAFVSSTQRRLLWQFIGAALLVSSLGEIVISLAHASGHGT